MLRPILVLFAFAVPFAACGTSSRLIEDNLTEAASIHGVTLGVVRFDYSRWTNRDERDRTTAKDNEAAWAKALGDAFLARATERGFATGSDRTPVDITIIDLDPGEHTQRSDYGVDDGTGTVSALVEPQGHGSFRMNGKIGVGAWGGDFVRVLDKLGKEIADHLIKRRGLK